MQSAKTSVFRSMTVPTLSRMVQATAARVMEWTARANSRKGLGRLDSRLLQDIGVDAATAQHQATLPFWRA